MTRFLSFSHGGNGQELQRLDTIWGWKALETLVSINYLSIFARMVSHILCFKLQFTCSLSWLVLFLLVLGYRGDRGRYRGGSLREDYGYRRSPRRSPYRGAREYSPRHTPPYGGRSRRDHSRSPPYSPPYGSPDRRYPRGSRWGPF